MDYSATASYLVVYLPDFESPPGHCTVRELEQEPRLLFLQLYGERCIWPTKSTKWVQLYCLEESLKTDFVYNIFFRINTIMHVILVVRLKAEQ